MLALPRWLALITAACLMIGLSACNQVQQLSREFDPAKRPEDVAYQQAIQPYLTRGSVYHGPATEIIVRALSLTPTVRLAMVQREAVSFDLDEARKEKMEQDQLAAADRAYEFAISVYVPERKWNDLVSAKPDWRVYLQNAAGQKVDPLDKRLIKARNSLNQVIYPFWGQWDKLYLISFPRINPDGSPFLSEGETKVILVVAGPPGQTEIPMILK